MVPETSANPMGSSGRLQITPNSGEKTRPLHSTPQGPITGCGLALGEAAPPEGLTMSHGQPVLFPAGRMNVPAKRGTLSPLE